MQQRTINAEHLKLALVTLRMRRINPDIAQFAALSNGATWQRCDRRTTPSGRANRWTHPPMMVPMLPSISEKLIRRVRLTYGIPEVTKTWGKGYKALIAEVAPKRRS